MSAGSLVFMCAIFTCLGIALGVVLVQGGHIPVKNIPCVVTEK